ASGGAAALTLARTARLTSMTSGTASSTNCASPTASSRLGAAQTLRSTVAVAPSGRRPADSNSRVSSSNWSRLRRAMSAEASASATRAPAKARIWAIPLPMYPAPTTAALPTIELTLLVRADGGHLRRGRRPRVEAVTQPLRHQQLRQLKPDDPLTEGEHLSVVGQHSPGYRVAVVSGDRPDALDLVGGDGDAQACPADEQGPVGFAAGHLAGRG